MTKTLIIGKSSNLSKYLHRSIIDSFLISSREIINNINILEEFKSRKINIIFNNFQPAVSLNILDNSQEYIENSILSTSLVLEYFKNASVNKIIYTSSSSVYGTNEHCNESDDLKPTHLHAALKIANEKLVIKYCEDKNIKYSIARVFNMYGGNDYFSIVSKILNAVKNKKEITVINDGSAIRDFIYIDDVVKIYTELLAKNINTINIGTGKGISIKELISFLGENNINLDVNNLNRAELNVSISDATLLYQTFDRLKFKEVKDYLLEELNLCKNY